MEDPGCGVDIPAALYSLSFAPNLRFSRFFPKQQEILEYMNDVANRFNLTDHFMGNTEWVGADWQDDICHWSVSLRETSTGRLFTHQCAVLISAVGGLSNPNRVTLPGSDKFKGTIMHTAEWDRAISTEKRDVVVIGNGCILSPLSSLFSQTYTLDTRFADCTYSIGDTISSYNCGKGQVGHPGHPGLFRQVQRAMSAR